VSSDLSFDVAIAGAGLAGASLALRMARDGLNVALLDATTFPRPKLCGEYLSPEGVEALERLGLGAAVAEAGGEPIGRVRLSTPRGRVLEADVAGPDGRPGLGLSRATLDERLVRAARGAGVTVLEGCRVAGALVESGRVLGLRARASGEAEAFEVRARLVVAADGRHSALVRQTGVTRGRSRLPTRPRLVGLKRHLRVADDSAAEPPGAVGLHLVRGGYGGTCRIEGGLTNFCALIPESVVGRHRGDLDAAARGAFGSNPVLARLFDAAEPAGPWKTVAGVRVEISSPTIPGILYAGDCQGTVDPLGGQGMTMALLGAEAMTPMVLHALDRGGEGITPGLQREVLRRWRSRFDRRVRFCRLFHHVLVRPGWIDVMGAFPTLAPRVLAGCFRWTRDGAAPECR
jgi:flavin-dependent dehydrogenase